MNRKLIYAMVLTMTAVMAWFAGYLKLPFVAQRASFWMGFFVCLAAILFVRSWIVLWNGERAYQSGRSAYSFKRRPGFWLSGRSAFSLLVLMAISGGFGAVAYSYVSKIKEAERNAKEELDALKQEVSVEEQRTKIRMLLDLLHTLDSVRLQAKDKSGLGKMIDRLVALSSSFVVHKEWTSEKRSPVGLSSERALLLLALVHSQMDSASFQKIRERVSFSGADLRNADLHGVDLSRIDLRYSNLENANMEGTRLDYADLRGAKLTGVNFNRASLVETILISTDLRGSKMNEAKMNSAKLDSADLSNVTLHKAILHSATFIHTQMCNAILNEADVTNGFLFGTNICNANFSKTLLNRATFTNVRVAGAHLDEAIIDKDWLDQLKEKNPEAVQELSAKYRMVTDSITIKDSMIFRLSPRVE